MAGEATDRPPIGVAVGVGMPSLAPPPKPSPREGVEEEDCMAGRGGVGATRMALLGSSMTDARLKRPGLHSAHHAHHPHRRWWQIQSFLIPSLPRKGNHASSEEGRDSSAQEVTAPKGRRGSL